MPDKKYKPSPYNYCDYRCERCDEKENCRVYKDNSERVLQHYLKGEDPYDPDVFLSDLHDIFAKTKDMVMDMANKQGIEINKTSQEEVDQIDPGEYTIYCIAHEYFKEASGFIKELEKSGIPVSLKEDFSNLIWYHTLIAAKSGRLVSGFIDDFLEDEIQDIEEKGTLQVINKGIDLSKKALQSMLNELPDHLPRIADLMALLKKLEDIIKTDIRQKVTE
ncbi:MAG: hypothetical protein WBB37_07145 [bacterium]